MNKFKKVLNVIFEKEDQKKAKGGNRTSISDDLFIKVIEHEGNVSKFCRENGISRTLYYNLKDWRKKYTNEMDKKRFERLENEVINKTDK